MRNQYKLKKTNFFATQNVHFSTASWLACLIAFAAPMSGTSAHAADQSITNYFVQNREITGKITDTQGQPLSDVTINAVGTKVSVASKADGTYVIKAPQGARKLIFTRVGYTSQEMDIRSASVIDVVLSPSSDALDEVVVVGYGTMRKKDLTGSIVQIRPDRIANENPKTVQDILRGTPGVRVGYDASAKGGGEINIRGRRSVYNEGGHNSPLIILDGMIFYGELSEINPDDIEQIDILKDASAAAVYGAKAASGVIIINTKKGKQGKPVINLTTNVGTTTKANYRKRFTPDQYLQHRQDWLTVNTYGVNPTNGNYEAYQEGVYKNRPGYFMRPDQLPASISLEQWRAYDTNPENSSDLGIWGSRLGFRGNALQNFLNGKVVDWEDITFRSGLDQDYNLSVSGASERTNYYLSAGYLKNQGAVVSDQYQAVRANMKIDTKVTDWLQVAANVNFQDRSDGNIDVDLDYMLRNSPYADYVDDMGRPVQFPLSGEYSQRGYNYDFQRQYMDLEKGYTIFNSIFQAKVKLPFHISYAFNASPRYQFFYDRYFMSASLPGSDPASRGVNREQGKRFDWSLNNTLTWDQTFMKKHHFTVTLVQEAEKLQSWTDRIEARNILPSDALGFHNTQNGSKENSQFATNDGRQTATGLLGRLFYSYDDRYMLTASLRRDGYSAFGSSNPYANFPSVAVAWTFTNERFFNWKDVMSSGKLRISYGENGNRSLENPYVALANLSSGTGKMQGYIDPTGKLLLYRYLMADRLANPYLQWEKTASWNVGLDFGFLDNRISGSLEYYNMNTNDMIMGQRLPSFTGFKSITTNLGQVNNSGVELSLNTTNINRTNFQWSTTFGFSYNKNKIKHLYYDYKDVLNSEGQVVGRKEMDDISNAWFIGQPIGAIWNYRVTGIWQANEVQEAAKYGQKPGDPKVANNYTADDVTKSDGSITHVYNDRDKEFLGETLAPINWSIRNQFTLWRDLSLSFNIYSYMGHKSLFGEYLNNDDLGGRMTYALQNVTAKEYWTPDNPTNDYGRIGAVGPTGAVGAQKLYSRSFIRLENVSVAYTLPKVWTSKVGVDRVKLYGTVRNVATWAKDWKFGDPEADPDFGRGGGLATRIYTVGLNLVF